MTETLGRKCNFRTSGSRVHVVLEKPRPAQRVHLVTSLRGPDHQQSLIPNLILVARRYGLPPVDLRRRVLPELRRERLLGWYHERVREVTFRNLLTPR